MRYEDGLEAGFREGHANLTLLALTHLAGFSSRLPAWTSLARQAEPVRVTDGLQVLFESLLTGDALRVEDAVRSADPRNLGFLLSFELDTIDRASPEWLATALKSVVDPLILLGRGDLVSTLHARSLQPLGPGQYSFMASAASSLAQAADWPHAVEILEDARRMRTKLDLGGSFEDLLWKYAYLHGETERAMPVLARVSLRNDQPHSLDDRAWRLKAYQIRAGKRDVEIPIIETNRQLHYMEAVATQIAALEDDPAAANLVQSLRRSLRPRPVEIIHADRGLAAMYDPAEQAMSKAAAGIAARRKDNAKAAELARAPVRGLLDPAQHVIDALMDEGDWRAAANIARDHDPRRKKVIPGFDDTRIEEYVRLFKRFALAAAWSGDDGAAADFIAAAEDAREGGDRLSWPRTLLAGAAEGLLPRKLIPVLDEFLWP